LLGAIRTPCLAAELPIPASVLAVKPLLRALPGKILPLPALTLKLPTLKSLTLKRPSLELPSLVALRLPALTIGQQPRQTHQQDSRGHRDRTHSFRAPDPAHCSFSRLSARHPPGYRDFIIALPVSVVARGRFHSENAPLQRPSQGR
jgi:hypothetical protein